MARDYLELGEVPYDEKCAQVGVPGYIRIATIEAAAYVNQLRRLLRANNKENVNLLPKWEYSSESSLSVVVYFDDGNEEQVDTAYWLDANLPEKWDAEALAYLDSKDYDKLYSEHQKHFNRR